MLERRILVTLQGGGDNAQEGLYRQILSCQTMDSFSLIKGQILGFEAVLTMMREVAQEMNRADEPIATRMRAN